MTPKAKSLINTFSTHRIITLEHRADRRQEVVQEFSRHLMYAVPHFHLVKKPTEMPPGWPTLGTYGCFMSHLAVLREFVNGPDKTLLVMEDDVQFTRNVNDIVESLPENWDLIYFGALNFKAPNSATAFMYLNPQQMVIGLSCYAIRKPAAAAIVKYLDEVLTRPEGHPDGGPQHVDGAFSMFRCRNPDFLTLLASPYVASERASATDIHDTMMSRLNEIPVIGASLKIARRIKNSLFR